MSKIHKIYAIKNNIDEYVYIGRTNQELEERFNQHKNDKSHPDKVAYITDEENGCEIIELHSTEYEWEVPEWEQYYIDLYASDRLNSFNRIRAKKMSQIDKTNLIYKLKRSNNTINGEFDFTDGDDDLFK